MTVASPAPAPVTGENENKILVELDGGGSPVVARDRQAALMNDILERIERSRERRAALAKLPRVTTRRDSAPICEEWRRRFTRFYNHYNPEVVQEGRVELMLERYRGVEERVFERLRNHFGPEPVDDATAPPDPPTGPSSPVRTTIREYGRTPAPSFDSIAPPTLPEAPAGSGRATPQTETSRASSPVFLPGSVAAEVSAAAGAGGSPPAPATPAAATPYDESAAPSPTHNAASVALELAAAVNATAAAGESAGVESYVSQPDALGNPSTTQDASPLKYRNRRRASTVHPGEEVMNIRDKYGFIVDDDDVQERLDHHEASPEVTAALRATCAWLEVEGAALDTSDDPAIPDVLHELLLHSGVPEEHRKALWFRASGARRAAGEGGGRAAYEALVAAPERLSAGCARDINKDMDRTFPSCKQFEKGEATWQELYNVLAAFCIEHEDTGYCQGMNFIAGILLMYLDDDEAFYLLSEIVNSRKFNEGYYKTMENVQLDQQVLNKLVRERLPGVVEKLEEVNLNLETLVVKWFLCIFVDAFPLPATLVLWDFYFIHGIPFIFSTVLALLKTLRDKIMATDDLGMLMMMVKKEAMQVVDPLPLVRTALREYPLSLAELHSLRAACKADFERQQEEIARRREEMRARRERAEREAEQEAEKKNKKRGFFKRKK